MVYCLAQLAMVAEPFAIERKRAVDASAAVAHGDIGKVVELAALTVIEQHADREVLAITAIAIPLAHKGPCGGFGSAGGGQKTYDQKGAYLGVNALL